MKRSGAWDSALLFRSVRTLHPAYFALTMATGIVSVAVRNLGLPTVSAILLWVAGGSYLILALALVWRVAAYRHDVRGDLSNPGKAFGFFTVVAGTNVLGTRLALDGHVTLAVVLLVVGGVTWLLVGYMVPWTAALAPQPRPEAIGANGSWFVWVVASQSVAVLAAVLEPAVGSRKHLLSLVAIGSWSVGVVLYGVVGTLVVAHLLREGVRPLDFTPPYWIAMGATAITALAGARIGQIADIPSMSGIVNAVAIASMVYWAFGTWLVPALLVIGWWRHVVHRVPLRYDPSLWSIVFPLGMYSVASYTLGSLLGLPIVEAMGKQEGWIALGAWALTFIAMAVHLARSFAGGLAPSTGGGERQ